MVRTSEQGPGKKKCQPPVNRDEDQPEEEREDAGWGCIGKMKRPGGTGHCGCIDLPSRATGP